MAEISDQEAHKLVIGVLYEVGWRRADIIALLKGPYAFFEHLRHPEAEARRLMANYDPHEIMKARLHRDTEPAGHGYELHTETADIHDQGIGTITERLGEEEE